MPMLPLAPYTFAMQNSEIELKFPVDDPQQFQARLPALGFHLETPRTFESNTLYDTRAHTLREARQILRIRSYGALWTLTHKRPSAEDSAGSRYKVRVETETHLDDGPALALIFEQLGYLPTFRYEKFRTEWTHASDTGGHLVIDETAIGTWAELEGPPAWIDRMLGELRIDPATCITASYGKLFLNWKARTGSSAENLAFDEIAAAQNEEKPAEADLLVTQAN